MKPFNVMLFREYFQYDIYHSLYFLFNLNPFLFFIDCKNHEELEQCFKVVFNNIISGEIKPYVSEFLSEIFKLKSH